MNSTFSMCALIAGLLLSGVSPVSGAAIGGYVVAPPVYSPPEGPVSRGEQGEKIASINFPDGGRVTHIAADQHYTILGTIRTTATTERTGVYTFAVNRGLDIEHRGEYQFPVGTTRVTHCALSPDGSHAATVSLEGGKQRLSLVSIDVTLEHPTPVFVNSLDLTGSAILHVMFTHASPAKVMVITPKNILLVGHDLVRAQSIAHSGRLHGVQVNEREVASLCKFYHVPPPLRIERDGPDSSTAPHPTTPASHETPDSHLPFVACGAGARRVPVDAPSATATNPLRIAWPLSATEGVELAPQHRRLLMLYQDKAIVFNLTAERFEEHNITAREGSRFIAADCSHYPECLIAEQHASSPAQYALIRYNFVTGVAHVLGNLPIAYQLLGQTKHGLIVTYNLCKKIKFYNHELKPVGQIRIVDRALGVKDDEIKSCEISLNNECLFVRNYRTVSNYFRPADDAHTFSRLYYCGKGASRCIMLAGTKGEAADPLWARWLGFFYVGESNTAHAGIYATDKHALNVCYFPKSWIEQQQLHDRASGPCSIM